MGKYLLLVVSNPVDGKDEEYNRWYTDRHIKDVVAIDEFTSASRFKVLKELTDLEIGGKYVALYEFESEDPDGIIDVLSAAADAGKMPMSDAIREDDMRVTVLAPIAAYP